MIRIWGRLSSINVRKVVFTAKLLGLRFERVEAGGEFGIVNTPDYLARNPNAMVPLLDDEGFTLWESNVIVRYLGARYGTGAFYPQDLQGRFDAERWMDWQQTTMNKAGRDAFLQLVRTPSAQRQQRVVDASIAATDPLWDMLESHLEGRRFMAGDVLTMADVPIACEAHRWRGLDLAHPKRARLDAWYGRILALPAAQGVLDQPLS